MRVRPRPGATRAGRLRRPGHAGVRRACRSPTTCAWVRGSTRRGTARQADRADRTARSRSPPTGRLALRRSASPARADAGDREAARAADPRRAGGEPRSARPPRVPAVLMEVVAEHGMSVVLSSHLVADLERVCDYLIVLADSRVQVAGESRHVAGVAPPSGRARAATRTRCPRARSDRGEPHREAERAPRAHRRSDSRSRLDRRAGHDGRPRARVHGPSRSGQRRDAPPAFAQGSADDPVHLAPVPHPGRSRHRRTRSARDRPRAHGSAPRPPLRHQRSATCKVARRLRHRRRHVPAP